MPRKCSICIHKRRNEIEIALFAGKSFRHIASQFGINYQTIPPCFDVNLSGSM